MYPYLNYCTDVWGHCTEHLFDSLFKLQKYAIGIIDPAGRKSHTAPLFTLINISPLKNVDFYSISLLMFKFSKTDSSRLLSNFFSAMQPFTMSELSKQTYYMYVQGQAIRSSGNRFQSSDLETSSVLAFWVLL